MRTKTGNMKKMLFLIGCLLTALSSSPYVVTTPVSIAKYDGNRKAAISYTFDDGIQDQYTLAYPEMKKRGIRATFGIIGSKVGGIIKATGVPDVPAMTWDQIREMYADGFEIASHGYNHKKLTTVGDSWQEEVTRNDVLIEQEVGQRPLTFIYPYNGKSDEKVAWVESNHVGSRTYQKSMGGSANEQTMNSYVDGLINEGKWGVTMTHSIAEGYDHFQDPQRLFNHWDYVVTLQDELWIAPFHEVAGYVRERDNATVTTTDEDENNIVLSVSTTLEDKAMFAYPLTLLVETCADAATQDGNSLTVKYKGGQTIVSSVNPNGGAVTIHKSSATPLTELNKPTMGWSSWNTYRVNISDSLIMRQADAMVEKGLSKVGYRYVNIDDGYFGGRDRQTGRLLIHPTRFPRGLKPVVEHIHRLGLKAGIYSDAGRNTCGSIYDADTIGVGVGLYGHDQQDCDMFFRELGFDFIKVDYCGGKPHPKGDTLRLDEQTRYTEIADAISRTGRKDVRLNVCRWDYPGTWVSGVAASWRMSQDIRPKWASVKDIIQQNLYLSAYAGGGHYNDMDMLEVGRGMTQEEDHTHFAVWCMMSSPLLIGCDLTKMKPETLHLLTDKTLLAINQDPLGLQAYVAKRVGECYVLVKDLKQRNGKERAVAFVNLSDKEQTMTLDLRELDLSGEIQLCNLQDGGSQFFTLHSSFFTFALPPHATRVFVVRGTQRLQRRIYEAETAFLTSYQEIKNNQAFLTAIYEDDSRCSGGVKASWLGGRADNDLRWRDVYVDKAGRYALRLNCLTKEPRTLFVDVNGTTVDSLTFTADAEQTVFVVLKKGRNEVRLWNDDGRMPDVDYMIVDDSPVTFGKLTVEGRTQPLGLDDLQPRFGWQLISGENDVRQTQYHLQVSSTPEGQGDVWDSGEVNPDSSQWVAYKGMALLSNKDYYWKVRVKTNKGESGWSPVQKWSTGLLNASNWKGCWIGPDSITPDVVMERHSRIAARHLRKQFSISKPVKRATVHVCGLGYYILNINGQRIGDRRRSHPLR